MNKHCSYSISKKLSCLCFPAAGQKWKKSLWADTLLHQVSKFKYIYWFSAFLLAQPQVYACIAGKNRLEAWINASGSFIPCWDTSLHGASADSLQRLKLGQICCVRVAVQTRVESGKGKPRHTNNTQWNTHSETRGWGKTHNEAW